MNLAREHRVARQSQFLAQLYLGVPIGALHKPHGYAASGLSAQRCNKLDHVSRAPLVGLHGKSEAIVVAKPCTAEDLREYLQGQFEPLGFLGIDRQSNARGFGMLDELGKQGHELGHYPVMLRVGIARVQRR